MPRKTTLTEIREFLSLEGYAPEPWSTPEAVLQRLHDLLSARRDDERFWSRLKELVRDLDRARFDPRPLPNFEVLREGVVDDLLDDLRDSLEKINGHPRRPLREWLGRSAGFAAVAFLLLGITVSCQDPEAGRKLSAKSVDDWDCETEADTYSITDTEDRQRLCDLGDFVKAAEEVSEYRRELLLECLPGLDAAYRTDLLERFQSATSEELNDLLLDLTADYEVCGEEPYDDYDGGGGGCGFH